jgi:hypothetical protein
MKSEDEVRRIQAETQHFLKTEAAPLGLRVLREIAADRKASAGARTMAAKALADFSGVGARTDDDSRPLHMLSAAELHAKALKAQAWLDELERNTIEHEPAPSPAEEGGFFD